MVIVCASKLGNPSTNVVVMADEVVFGIPGSMLSRIYVWLCCCCCCAGVQDGPRSTESVYQARQKKLQHPDYEYFALGPLARFHRLPSIAGMQREVWRCEFTPKSSRGPVEQDCNCLDDQSDGLPCRSPCMSMEPCEHCLRHTSRALNSLRG